MLSLLAPHIALLVSPARAVALVGMGRLAIVVATLTTPAEAATLLRDAAAVMLVLSAHLIPGLISTPGLLVLAALLGEITVIAPVAAKTLFVLAGVAAIVVAHGVSFSAGIPLVAFTALAARLLLAPAIAKVNALVWHVSLCRATSLVATVFITIAALPMAIALAPVAVLVLIAALVALVFTAAGSAAGIGFSRGTASCLPGGFCRLVLFFTVLSIAALVLRLVLVFAGC